MAKKGKSPVSIDAIIKKDLPNMRVVKRKQGTRSKIAQPDAKAPDIARRPLASGLTADAAGDVDDDDVTLVNVEPKKAQSQDFGTSSSRVVLVSKSKKKVIALQG